MRQFYKMHGKYINKKETKKQKLKHIKYTKLSPILSEIVPSPAESPSCRTLLRARRCGDPSRQQGLMSRSLFCEKGSRHLVLWSLENLTDLSEILRQGTGCVNGRFQHPQYALPKVSCLVFGLPIITMVLMFSNPISFLGQVCYDV